MTLRQVVMNFMYMVLLLAVVAGVMCGLVLLGCRTAAIYPQPTSKPVVKMQMLPVRMAPIRYGDLNCDGVVNFADINPFVLYQSNHSAWMTTYPLCDPHNGDMNEDDRWPDVADINIFVWRMNNPLCVEGYVRTSGGYGIEGISMLGFPPQFEDRPVLTNFYGRYRAYVPRGWSGTITPVELEVGP